MSRASAAATEAYRNLCAAQDVPLFHQPWWLDAVCERWIGTTIETKAGAALWPVPLERKVGVRISRNPALTPYLGPAFLTPSVEANNGAAVQNDALLRALLNTIPRLPVWYTAARAQPWSTQLFEKAGFTTGWRPTYLLPISDDTEEELWASLHTDIRRAIRRVADTVTISCEPDAASALFSMQQATLQRKGARLLHSEALIRRLVEETHRRHCGALWTARREGKIVGAQWSVWDGLACYNLSLARVDGDEGKYVPASLLWHAIRHARSLGLRVFDFEGSSIPGIAKFFAQFGGVVQPYLTLHKNTSLIWRAVRRLRS